jgi:hypothetical protein
MVTTRIAPLAALGAAVLVGAVALGVRGGDTPAPKPPAPAAIARVRPARDSTAVAPAARGARARVVQRTPTVTLPVDSPWALPPMMVMQSRTGGHASAALRRRVLHLAQLALSPSARRSVRRGLVTDGALRVLAAFPRTGGPLLVLTLEGRRIRAQEATLWMTRSALRKLRAMPVGRRPHRLLLEPVATDRIDLDGPPRAKPGVLRTLVGIYRNAGYQYGIDWRVLAAINRVETNFGHNTHVSTAGAVGRM